VARADATARIVSNGTRPLASNVPPPIVAVSRSSTAFPVDAVIRASTCSTRRCRQPMAALVAVKLARLKEYSARRRENAAYYSERLGALRGVATSEPDGKTHGIQLLLPSAYAHNEHIWNQYTVRVLGGRRDTLREHLAAREIGAEIYYPLPLHRQECFLSGGAPPVSLPACEKLASQCLSLPIYPDLSRPHQDAVVEAIAEFLRP